jgi:ribose transport system substrate-binding protein
MKARIITLATNNYEAGKIAGENMLEELELYGYQNGEIGIISVLETNPTIIERDNGFIDTI